MSFIAGGATTSTSSPASRAAARNGRSGPRWPAPPSEHAPNSRTAGEPNGHLDGTAGGAGGSSPETGDEPPADLRPVLVVGGARDEQALLGQRPTDVAGDHEDHHENVP